MSPSYSALGSVLELAQPRCQGPMEVAVLSYIVKRGVD